MKVLLVTSSYLPTINGVTTHLESLATSLKKLGHEVTILCPYHKKRTDYTDIVEIRSLYNPFNPDYPLPFSQKIPKEIRKEHYDIVHLHHPFGIRTLGEKIVDINNTPLIFTNHTQYLTYVDYYLPLIRSISRIYVKRSLINLYKKATFVLCSTNDIANNIRQLYKKAPIKVIPVPFNNASLDKKTNIDIRKKHNIDKKDFIYVYVGRVAEEKNMKLLIDAHKEALRDGKRVKLIIVGDGNIRKTLEKDNTEVVFTGMLDEQYKSSYFSQADMFVSASTSETLGLVFAEAAYCGTPLLGIDSPGIKDVIKPGLNGWLAKDANEFIALYKSIIADTEVKRLRKDCTESVQSFSIKNVISQITDTYKEAIDF